MKTGFGKADRFLYVKMARRLATCQPNLSPANYNHHEVHKKMTEYPCTTLIVSLARFVPFGLVSHSRVTLLRKNWESVATPMA